MQFTKEVQPNLHRAEKLFWFRPVFFTALFLCLGISFAYLRRFSGISPLWLLLTLPLIGVVSLRQPDGVGILKRLLAVLLCLISFLFGYLSFWKQLDDFAGCDNFQTETIVQGTLIQRNDYGELSVFRFSNLYIDGNKTEGELTSYLPTTSVVNYKIGDKVILHGKVYTDVEFFDEYGFKTEEIKRKSCYYIRDAELVKVGKSNNLFFAVQNKVKEVLCKGMGKDAAAVTMGILLGDTEGIEQDLYDNVRFGGIAHIFAVSGLHVGALFAFCLFLIRKTNGRIPKLLRFVLLSLILIFYAGVCGFSASVVRAIVICLTFYASSLLRLHADFLERLGFSAAIILILNPVALFEVGFQLSFLACFGIAFLAAPLKRGINRLLDFRKEINRDKDDQPLSVAARIRLGIVSAFSVSLAAQLFTAPVLLYKFSYLSGAGLLLNVLFVPLISAVFSVLLLLTAIACICPIGWSIAILYIPNVVLHALLLLFEVIDFSKFAIQSIAFTSGGIVCYYAGLVFCSDKCNLSAKRRYAVSLLFGLAFVFSTLFLNL